LATRKLPIAEQPVDAASAATQSLTHDHLAVLVSTIGMRLSRGSSAFYRRAFDISTVEWRLLMTLDRIDALNVSELSEAALVDKAAVSRSLVLLQDRQLVDVEQTRSRGRAAIVRLTPEGRAFVRKLSAISNERDARLFKTFTPDDKAALRSLLDHLAKALDDADWDR
jgi:DNA-binding MarR family transcriptional regulator